MMAHAHVVFVCVCVVAQPMSCRCTAADSRQPVQLGGEASDVVFAAVRDENDARGSAEPRCADNGGDTEMAPPPTEVAAAQLDWADEALLVARDALVDRSVRADSGPAVDAAAGSEAAAAEWTSLDVLASAADAAPRGAAKKRVAAAPRLPVDDAVWVASCARALPAAPRIAGGRARRWPRRHKFDEDCNCDHGRRRPQPLARWELAQWATGGPPQYVEAACGWTRSIAVDRAIAGVASAVYAAPQPAVQDLQRVVAADGNKEQPASPCAGTANGDEPMLGAAVGDDAGVVPVAASCADRDSESALLVSAGSDAAASDAGSCSSSAVSRERGLAPSSSAGMTYSVAAAVRSAMTAEVAAAAAAACPISSLLALAWACRRLRVSAARARDASYFSAVNSLFRQLAPALRARALSLKVARAVEMKVWPRSLPL